MQETIVEPGTTNRKKIMHSQICVIRCTTLLLEGWHRSAEIVAHWTLPAPTHSAWLAPRNADLPASPHSGLRRATRCSAPSIRKTGKRVFPTHSGPAMGNRRRLGKTPCWIRAESADKPPAGTPLVGHSMAALKEFVNCKEMVSTAHRLRGESTRALVFCAMVVQRGLGPNPHLVARTTLVQNTLCTPGQATV